MRAPSSNPTRNSRPKIGKKNLHLPGLKLGDTWRRRVNATELYEFYKKFGWPVKRARLLTSRPMLKDSVKQGANET